MKIERAELRLVPLRLREPFESASGRVQDRLILLLTLHADGVAGWGECVVGADPGYTLESPETAWRILSTQLLPAVTGLEVEEPGDLLVHLAGMPPAPLARAAVEMAAWDLYAKTENVSLPEALGSAPRPVAAGVSVGLQPTDEALLAEVERYASEGYQRVKIKITPGRDVETLAKVRERFPRLPLMADANAAYRLADADRLLALDDLGLSMIEQPLPAAELRDHARLQERMRTAICLDESIASVEDARVALELGACRVINIKPGRVGGHANARAIHDHCRAAGVPVWCGGMLESGIGRAHNVALSCLPGFAYPGDLSASRRYWERDLISPEFELQAGTLSLPPGAGIAVEPNVGWIDALATRRAAFS